MSDNLPKYSGIDHHSIIIADVKRCCRFYRDIVGLEVDQSRPELSFDGIWFKVGEQAIHCLKVNNPDPTQDRPPHGGRDRHVCLNVADINPLIESLERHYIDYTKSQSGRLAIFFRDPDGNAIEVKQQDCVS